MINKKVFLDANVVVKILEGFEVTELFENAENYEIYTSVVCFNIVAYLWEIGKIKCNKKEFDNFLGVINLLDITAQDCFVALDLSGHKDIEDGLQIVCAINNGMQGFFTYDKKLFNKYKNLHNINITLCK